MLGVFSPVLYMEPVKINYNGTSDREQIRNVAAGYGRRFLFWYVNAALH